MQIRPPRRVTRSYTQRLVAAPSRVFELLCPVREADWIDGWDPLLVLTDSGLVEPGCVFVTAASPHDAVWVVTRHEPENHFVEMFKITPSVTVCRLTIQVRAGHEQASEAQVTYSHTSLGPDGDRFVDAFTPEHYQSFMQDWEARMNHYLVHGTALQRAG